jgi:hypothetical protein
MVSFKGAHFMRDIILTGSVANFAQEVLEEQLTLSVRGIGGQGVEPFGHREALLDFVVQLLFAQHVHQFDTNES